MAQVVYNFQYGPANTFATGVYVNIIPPPGYIEGNPSDIGLISGTASWGALNTPQFMGGGSDATRLYGGITAAGAADPFDMCSSLACAFLQGQSPAAMGVWGIRVDHGDSAHATKMLKDTTTGTALNGCTAQALYTGTLGNQITVTITAGAKTGTVNVSISGFPGVSGEVFSNLPSVGAGVFWNALANAVNFGQNVLRAASNLVRINTVNASAIAPALGSFTLISGTDGRGAVVPADIIGTDAVNPPTGLYAISQMTPAPGVVWTPGLQDNTAIPNLTAFANKLGAVIVIAMASGTGTDSAISSKKSWGVDDPNVILIKDYIYWYDETPAVATVRFSAPDGFMAGLLMALGPHESPANKKIAGIIGTERSSPMQGGYPYSILELGDLEVNGIQVITNPIDQGNVFGCKHGRNTSSDPVRSPIEYARMTNYTARAIGTAVGKFIGELQSTQADDPTRSKVKLECDSFLERLRRFRMIDSYLTTCDKTNNSDDSIAAHYAVIDVKVRYLSSIYYFIVNYQGGTTVVTVSNSANSQPIAA